MSGNDVMQAMDAGILTAQEMSDELKRFKGAEKNAPCPCGSGRKFKKCCKPKLAEWQSQVEKMLREQSAKPPSIEAQLAKISPNEQRRRDEMVFLRNLERRHLALAKDRRSLQESIDNLEVWKREIESWPLSVLQLVSLQQVSQQIKKNKDQKDQTMLTRHEEIILSLLVDKYRVGEIEPTTEPDPDPDAKVADDEPKISKFPGDPCGGVKLGKVETDDDESDADLDDDGQYDELSVAASMVALHR